MNSKSCCTIQSIRSATIQTSPTTISSGQITPWGVSRVGGPFDGVGKKAWIIGTGIDLNNEDLNVDIANSTSFVATESAQDVIGRGTYVAGILAAKNNSIDVVGVAAGATIVGVKVIASVDSASTSDILDGINYVTSKASSSDIINISWEIRDPNDNIHAIDDAITNSANSGLRYIIAAGDNGEPANRYTPSRVNNSNVWTVSAFKKGDTFAYLYDCLFGKSSNHGNPPIDYSEPGDSIHPYTLVVDGDIALDQLMVHTFAMMELHSLLHIWLAFYWPHQVELVMVDMWLMMLTVIPI